MHRYALAILIIFALFVAWVWVQAAARRFAQRHPEFGPAKEEGAGCASGCCGCALAERSRSQNSGTEARQSALCTGAARQRARSVSANDLWLISQIIQ